MRLEPPVRRLDECERECGKQLLRPEPDEAAAAQVDVRLEGCRVARADAAVQAVRRDDDVGTEVARGGHVVRDVVLESQFDAEFFAARLQDVEQALAPDAAEAVATGRDRVPLEVDVDVVPPVERAGDRASALRIGRLEVAERLVGKHDPPPERVVGPVAFDDAHDVVAVRLLEQKAEVEAGGAAADAKDAHGNPRFVIILELK